MPVAEVSAVLGKASARAARAPVEPVELPTLLSALRAAGGNVARAAAMLGITRQRAYRMMEGHAVDLEAIRGGEGGHK
jgi:transcriptional regulator of acetoin/glycerol metabolism